MNLRSIRQRNKHQMVYGYAYKIEGAPSVARRIATRDKTRLGIFHIDKAIPGGTRVFIGFDFNFSIGWRD